MGRGWLVLALVLTGCGGNASPPAINVGHVATLSGADKEAGDQAARAIRLAVEEHNKTASEEGRRPIVVRHTDTRGKLEAFEAEAVRLVAINKVVALLGGTTSEEAVRLERAQVPLVSPLGTRPRGLSELAFTTGLAPAFQGQVLARFAAENLGASKIAVLADERRETALLVAEAFARALPKVWAKKDATVKIATPSIWRYGTEIPADWPKRLAAEKPEAILIAGSARDVPKMYKDLGKAAPLLFAGEEGSGKALLETGGLDGIYLATAFVSDVDVTRAKEFIAHYRQAFSEEPDVHAALAFDGARMLFEAIAHGEAPLSVKGIQAKLAELKDFPGLTGPLSMAADHHVRRPAFIVRVEKGRLKTVKTFAQEASE